MKSQPSADTDSSTVALSYDAIGQLTVADSSVNSEDRGYYYDAAWNLNRRTNNGTPSTFAVDTKNQLTSGPGALYSYDNNGNLTNNLGGLAYAYDDENRLAFITSGTSWRTGFIYDGVGRMRKQISYAWISSAWVAQSTNEYVYDGKRVIQERTGSNVPSVSYTRGIDLSGSFEGAGGIGGLLARSSGYSSGTGNWSTHNYYHADGNGNITYVQTSAEGLGAKYRYDPFGNVISQSGTLAAVNTYRFSSKECHDNSGLYYFLYRWYDPNTQRWMNRDPIGESGGRNLFMFTHNAPVYSTDPLGLRLWYCTRPANPPFNVGGGRHGYFWNDADDNNLKPEDRECGQEKCSSSPGKTTSNNDGPLAGDGEQGNYVDPDHWTDGTHECSAIPGPSWPDWDKDFMKQCKAGPGKGGINDLPWAGYAWTCNDSARCFAERYGIHFPNIREWNRQPPFGERPNSRR